MVCRMTFKTLLLCLALVMTSLVAGFCLSVAVHGDLMILRKDKACAAYDPVSATYRGTWSPRSDGRCWLGDYYRGRVFP